MQIRDAANTTVFDKADKYTFCFGVKGFALDSLGAFNHTMTFDTARIIKTNGIGMLTRGRYFAEKLRMSENKALTIAQRRGVLECKPPVNALINALLKEINIAVFTTLNKYAAINMKEKDKDIDNKLSNTYLVNAIL